MIMNLTKLRKSRGLSQKALADMIGMDAATVNRAEKMHPSAKLATYVACADALGVTVEEIFGNDIEPMEAKIIEAFRLMSPARKQRVAELLDLIEAPQNPATE
jgi:transcriptional regulator with XRE-family HTH domain